MRKINKRERKALRSVWRLGNAQNSKQHSRRITMAMERACRTRTNTK